MNTISEDNFIIETNRLILTPIKESDAILLWPHVTNPNIARYMSWNVHESINETNDLINRLIENCKLGLGITWSIFHKEQNEFCGIFSIISILRKHRACVYDRGELACWCAPKYQIDKIMDESGHAVIKFAFEVLKLNKLMNAHFSVNIASERFINRLNFNLIGEEKQAFQKNDVWYDMKLYELLSEDYYLRKEQKELTI